MPLHNKGMSVRAISDYLNFHNIKSPHGKDYYPTLVSMTILKLKRRNDRLVNLKLKIKNWFWKNILGKINPVESVLVTFSNTQ